MSFISSRIWACRQTARAIFQYKGLFVMALCLAGLALTSPFFLGTLALSLSNPVFDVPTRTEITIFAERSAGKASVEKLAENIKALSIIDDVRVMDKKDALALVNNTLGLKGEVSKTNPLPDIVIATAVNGATSAELAEAADAIRKMDNVDTVAYDDRWTRHLASLYQALSIVLTLLGTVVFLLVLLVIFASVRLTTNAQKDEIRALYLFGATRSFIKRPYCWRGVLTLMLAAVLSLAITALGIHLLAQPIADFASLYGVRIELRMPASDWCLLYVAAASILGGLVGSFAASDAITRMRSPH